MDVKSQTVHAMQRQKDDEDFRSTMEPNSQTDYYIERKKDDEIQTQERKQEIDAQHTNVPGNTNLQTKSALSKEQEPLRLTAEPWQQ